MSHKLPRTLQAVPNTLHARLEIADAIRKLRAVDQEDWAQRRREEVVALCRDVEKIREDLFKISHEFPTLFLRELRKAGFNTDEPRVPAGNPQGGQWTTNGGSGSWIDSVADWFRHTSDPEWAEAQSVQDLVENHPRAAIISGSVGLGVALGPAIIALAGEALLVENFSVAGRLAELLKAIPLPNKGGSRWRSDWPKMRVVIDSSSLGPVSEWAIFGLVLHSILERFVLRVLDTLRQISSISLGRTALVCLKLERHVQFVLRAPR